MAASLTKTETLVLRAIKLDDEAALADAGHANLPEGTRFLLGAESIQRAARILGRDYRRQPGQASVYSALQRLVSRGLVEREVLNGLGGGFTLYRRTEKAV